MQWYRDPYAVDAKAWALAAQNTPEQLRSMIEDAERGLRSARDKFDAAILKADAANCRPNGSSQTTEQLDAGADLAAREEAFYAAKWTLWCLENALSRLA